jgi:hypothetical protein
MPTGSWNQMVRAILLTATWGVVIVVMAGHVPAVHSQAIDEQQQQLENALQN